MSEYATHGAMLECSCGTTPTPLQVTGNTSVFAQGQPMATVSDKAPMANIQPFGKCKMKPTITGYAPCVPAPSAWTGFVASVQIPGGNPLLNTSTIACSCGGMIKFKDSGQKKSNKVVIHPSSPQIDALRKAALNATPFCEECEKKEVKLEPKILRIFLVDETNREPHELSELEEGKEVTLCVEVEEGGAGMDVDVEIKDAQGRKFKSGQTSMKFKNLTIDDDNMAYVDNFSFEFQK